jgi:hypothetical protein
MAVTDPTGARMRTINAFFDSPRFPIKTAPFPTEPAAVVPEPTPTPTTPDVGAPAPGPAAPPLPPTLQIFLPKTRSTKRFLTTGLAFKVTASKAVSDVEVRLFQVLPGGGLRALGGAFRQDPGPAPTLVVHASDFARVKLKSRAKRHLQVVAIAVGRDGTVGRATASLTIS